MNYKKVCKGLLAIVGVSVFVIVYRTFNPYEYGFFPECPFKLLTGLACPGCGSQRAVHYLLNLDLSGAVKENVLLVFSIPYVLTGYTFEFVGQSGRQILKWRRMLFGQRAISIVLALVIVFWISRNLPFWPLG